MIATLAKLHLEQVYKLRIPNLEFLVIDYKLYLLRKTYMGLSVGHLETIQQHLSHNYGYFYKANKLYIKTMWTQF